MKLDLSDQTLLTSKNYLNGIWIDSDDGEVLNVDNPADGKSFAFVAKCGRAETSRMIDAAHKAQKTWSKSSVKERANLLNDWFDLVMANKEDLSKILTFEQGKPISEARAEIVYGANYIQWFAEESKRVYGDIIAPPTNDKRIMVIKQPIGVVACITPWNFPNAMLTRKIAPAIAAGCAVVCKPANATPLSALALVILAERAGFPPGLINIVTGNTNEIGAEMTSNSLVRKLTFTGSTPVGKKLITDCAQTVKRTSMELGGNAPFIIFDDADIAEAIKGLMISKYRNAGQTCVCTNRILVQNSVYDEFLSKFKAECENLVVGNGLGEETTIGPLINRKAAADVKDLIEDAKSKGAVSELGENNNAYGDCYVEPTILSNINTSMRVFNEEIFGPVAPIIKFESEDEAVELANKTEFGLAAYFYSRDIGRIYRVSEALEFGIVGVNEGIISNEMAPFGGIKESGNGREGSKYGLDDYLEIKYLCIGGIDQ